MADLFNISFNLVFFAKILGFVAFLVTCYGYTRAEDNQLRLAVAISSAILSIHFMMLGAWVAALSLFINAIRNNVSRYRTGFKWFLGFAIIQIIVSYYFYQSGKDLFPIIGSLISGYAVFCASKLFLRSLMLVCTLLWLVNNVLLMSYGAIMLDILGIIMNIYGMRKILLEQQSK